MDDFRFSTDNENFFNAGTTGEEGARNFLFGVGRDLKNLFIAVAVVYLVVGVVLVLFSGGSDEAVKKWKNSILWTTVGIIVMQSAYVFVSTLYDKNVSGNTANLLLDRVVNPFVSLLGTLASFIFLAVAFVAFFRLVTAGGNDEQAKGAKRAIFTGIVGFLLIKIPKVLVESIYGKAGHDCGSYTFFGTCRLEDPDLGRTVTIMTNFVNYLNGFLAVITVLLIIYAGWLVVSSGGEEDRLKRAKNIIKYAFVGIVLMVASYALFNFFLQKG